MRAIVVTEPGGPEQLSWDEVPDPVVGVGEVLLDVVAAGLNRADVMQRQGMYPPPPGASPYLGMECSGRIAALADDVAGWSVGDEVCALLAGGGYAEQVAVPATQLLPVPAGVDLVEAAGLPEVACTVWSNLFAPWPIGPGQLARTPDGEPETILVHGGSSGIGTFAIQLATAKGHRVLVTVGSAEKAEACLTLGATEAINYREEDFVARVAQLTDHRGVDVILDVVGARYLSRNVEALATGGRLVVIGLQGGTKAELDLGALLQKRAVVASTALRSRPTEGQGGKAEVVAGVRREVWPLVEAGTIRPIVDRIVPIARAGEAHERMESSGHIGKILLAV